MTTTRRGGSEPAGLLDQPPPRDLVLTARAIADEAFPGRRRSFRRGVSHEFYDFRQYTPGDPVGRIDWRVAARRDALFIRRRQHEASLTLTVVIDASSSMAFSSLSGSNDVTKLRAAQELAAALAVIALREGDRVRVHSDGPGGGVSTPTRAGLRALPGIVEAIASIHAGGGTGLVGGLETAGRTPAGAGIVVAIGDGLEDPAALLGALRAAGRRGGRGRSQVALIQVLADDELRPPPTGSRLIDPESRAATSIADGRQSAQFERAIARHNNALRTGLARMRSGWTLHRTGEPRVAALRRALAAM